MTYDYLIIGGGIIGISTAWQLQQRHPQSKILLLEKEEEYATHQTGHNSGVVHAGVYYTPGSLKARLCKAGAIATISFCQQNNIAYERCGKMLVTTNSSELDRMQSLFERCRENEIDVDLVSADELSKREPNIKGLGAIFVHDTAIVDYREVARKMLKHYQDLGGEALNGQFVSGLKETEEGVQIQTKSKNGNNQYVARYLISCAGLMADRLTRMMGIATNFQIIPYRGEYYQLPEKYNNIVNHLIYPIPDPALPFLGVHLTRMIDGTVTVGPNAVQGWKREGYGKINISPGDIWDMVTFSGFWKVFATHFRIGLTETKNSLWKPGYLKQVQKYCPQIQLDDLLPYPAGIRAQAVLKDGTLVHDFLFARSKRSLHVCNAPSPAATSAIPIGEYICDELAKF
ncbi:MAG: L-2-hydroxyglutarate oxidase [Desulfocapsaceae bacterium]|nr:L-2-hydroxyglutarate oxidase [Desulfocapsaceae bacterium]